MAVNYRDGIAILQLIFFPVLLVSAIIIWKRIGWRAAGQTWRYVITLSLLRIIGGICTLLTISNSSTGVYRAEIVCELIGLAPLTLTYIGLLGQIDGGKLFHPRVIILLTVASFVGLLLGIAGISTTDNNSGSGFQANNLVKASIGIFLAVFGLFVLMAGWLFGQLRSRMTSMQYKFFLAIALSMPFLLVRMIYSALGDFTTDQRFSALGGNDTVYLCMDVLEEIIAMCICVACGISYVFEKKRSQYNSVTGQEGDKVEVV